MSHPVSIKDEKTDSQPCALSKRSKKSKTYKRTAKKKSKKIKNANDISFESCYRFEATCPFKECNDYKKTIFGSQQLYQQHHALKHERRDRFRNNLVWRCPQCLKICSSFYNFSAHVSMHRDLCEPPWICTLSPMKHSKNYNDTDINICGKRSSTKNNLISHIRSVHKLNVVGYRQGRTSTKNLTAISIPPIGTNKKRKREADMGDMPQTGQAQTKQRRVDTIEHRPFRFQTSVDPSNTPGNVDSKQINVFPGFNQQCNTRNMSNAIAPLNSMSNNNNNSNNDVPALPTMHQLSNLCNLLQKVENGETNGNDKALDMSTFMNCVRYIKKRQQQQQQEQLQQQQQQQHYHHHHHHHNHNHNHNHNMKHNGTHNHRQHIQYQMNSMNQMRMNSSSKNTNANSKNINSMNHMNHMNRMNAIHNVNMRNMSDQNKVTLSIRNMIKTLNRMEHLSNINGLGMAQMNKMNTMFSMCGTGNVRNINNVDSNNGNINKSIV